jgi:osmotically-inducible protein OsmY
MKRVAAKSDSEIQEDVIRELKWDTRIGESDVDVEVDEGVVTLSGVVNSWGRRHAAGEAAHRVWGVLDLANDITVKAAGSPGRTDMEIALAVKGALIWDVFVPDASVRSTVSEGVVTLAGEVDTWGQREDAERAIRNLVGVRAVVNVIEVKAPKVDAARVRRSIEEALERQAEREAKRVWVEMDDGEAKVFGTVHSWAEKQAVVGAAKGTPGVRRVEDMVRIEPSSSLPSADAHRRGTNDANASLRPRV